MSTHPGCDEFGLTGRVVAWLFTSPAQFNEYATVRGYVGHQMKAPRLIQAG